jgi:hypothetical protein
VTGKLAGSVAAETVGRSGTDIRKYLEPGFACEYGLKPRQTILDKIRDEKPNFLVLQTVCSFITDEKTGADHAAGVTRYCEAIRAAGGETVIYEMGWGKSDREAEGRTRIREVAKKNRVRFYAPCSTAWARVYKERPDLTLQHPKDSSHPGDVGHFLNLACFYAALTGESPVGKLPRTYHVWPHGKYEADTNRLAAFKPDPYQAKLSKWMFKHMAMNQTATLDDATANYLETVAWQEYQAVQLQLKETDK